MWYNKILNGGDALVFSCLRRFQIQDISEQGTEKKIVQTAGCCRFVYNHFVEEALAVYEKKHFFPYAKFHIADLPALKEEHPFLKDVDPYALERAIYQLSDAEKRFLDEKLDSQLPKKKTRAYGGSFKVKKPTVSADGKHISVPDYGVFKCALSRPPKGTILSGTISMTPSDEFYISLTCKFNPKEKQKTGAVVGIDLGVEEFAVTSDGDRFPNEHMYSRELKRLRRLQRALSRKLEAGKGADARPNEFKGHNITKNRLKIARIYEQIKNQMRDSIQKATTQLVERYDIICIENIDVSQIRGNKDYSKQMMDVLFYEFRRELEYKASWYGKTLVVVTGEDGASTEPHSASVEGARHLLEEGLKILNQ